MARSLKTSYLLLALGVSAVLALILGGLAYYEHRVNTADANQLTYATVEQKLESDLEARARSLSNITSSSLAPALKEGNNAAVAATPKHLLQFAVDQRYDDYTPVDHAVWRLPRSPPDCSMSATSNASRYGARANIFFTPAATRRRGRPRRVPSFCGPKCGASALSKFG